MQLDKIEDVLSENLGEGYRIVRDNDELLSEYCMKYWMGK